MGYDPQTYRFFLMTIDPVHVGTGGMLLGRVDNPIVREPGTRLPKIPGTALHGAIRHYAAARYGKISCAGQKGHCGRPTCPICYTFGSIEGETGSFSGVVSISDARILLFPVYSMVGPVWVTSPTVLYDAGIRAKDNDNKKITLKDPNKAQWSKDLWKRDNEGDGEKKKLPQSINLGWLMVEKDEGDLPNIEWPSNIPDQIQNRIVLVSDKLFSRIVNSNLEVRTSVSINPETGAAEEGALFTYEAIPRATVLWMDVVVDDFRGGFPSKKNLEKWGNTLKEKNDSAKQLLKSWHLWKEDKKEKFDDSLQKALNWVEDDLGKYRNSISWEDAAQVVTSGLEWAEHLGIGGMGTRGFGRVQHLK